MQEPPRCAVCCASEDLVGIVVGSKQLHLCSEHAGKLEGAQATSYADFASLFALPGLERRQRVERRQRRRRAFPPRPEGRRLNGGRRCKDQTG